MPAEIRCCEKWSGSPTIGRGRPGAGPLRVFQFLLRVSRDSSDLQCNFRSRTRSCRSVGLLERLQLQVESGHSMLFEIRKPECVL
jgi:hypothetical protein